MCAMADQQKVVYDLSIGTIFNDLKRSTMDISRSRQYSTLNMSVTVQDRHRSTTDNYTVSQKNRTPTINMR